MNQKIVVSAAKRANSLFTTNSKDVKRKRRHVNTRPIKVSQSLVKPPIDLTVPNHPPVDALPGPLLLLT